MNEQRPRASAIRSIEHIWIPMPDGTRLAARMWMPAHIPPAGLPAIFEYIPYRKSDMVRARDARNHPYLAENGYVSLRVDMRGSGDSDGVLTDMYTPKEMSDARDVIQWIAAQDWCNGRVGMFGTSWGGTASLQASIDAPDALKAVIAVCATHDRYEDDIHHMGGCLITDTLEWGATFPSILALPPTPESGEDWYDRWTDRLENLCSPVETWVREEARGDYWRHGSIAHQTDRIECPILSVGGWSDRYSNSVMSLVDACPDKAWGIVGPWGHHYPDHGHPGPAIGFQQVALDWWDHWLRPTGSVAPRWPKLRVWLREFDMPGDALDTRNGAWIETGPARGETQPHDLWLTQHNGLCSTPPKDQGAWNVPWDLLHGQAAGDTGYFGRFGGLPLEQSGDDAKALIFETPPLNRDLLLYGSAEVTLTIQTPNDRAQICLRLNDVAPDGTSSRIALAVLNLALDDTLDAPATPKGDGPQTVRPRFHTTAYRFKAGHRIRLAIAASYWPMVWTPPEQTDVKITMGQITLPVLVDAPSELQSPFPAPHDLPTQKTFETLADPRLIRSRDTTPDGPISVNWHQPLTAMRHDDIDSVFSFETWADHQIDPDDPTSATSIFVHHMTIDRPDGVASVASRLKATCDADHYILNSEVRVSQDGSPIFERHWSQIIDRRLS